MKKKLTAILAAVLIVMGAVPYAAADHSGGEGSGRELSREELAALSDSVSVSEDGFFLSVYDRPEEIDWHQVFYNGAGISVPETEEQIRAWESIYGELWTSLVVLPEEEIYKFVREKTGTEYGEARRPLSTQWVFFSDGDCWMHAHGDTNYQPIEFTCGTVDGDEYRLYYTRADWENYTEEREFVVTAHIRDGEWQFVSNLPADAPAPVTLLDIEFFSSREEFERTGNVLELIEVEQRSYDEPFGWCWAVITAREDNVRCVIERVESVFESGAIVPGDCLASGVLDRGESVALYVNRPWHPGVRVTAAMDAFWGEYVFGEDNWLYLDDSVPRYVTGRDLAGEGRGCYPADQSELARFLTDGAWVYLDEDTGSALAVVSFTDFWQMDITTRDEGYPIYLSYDRIYAGDREAPDLVKLEKGSYYYTEWTPLPDWYTFDDLGDYLLSAVQMDGEQRLYLTQANNGEAALGYLLGAGENAREFTLVRFRGTAVFEAQG